ncbi:MAG: preprotein translocase subunit SecE [Desulfobacterales bacterium]|nr:preprotein translocase subunit SecE [Desulfobacterales bacterium]
MEQTAVVRFLNRYFGDWIQFLREVKVELSKVTWPSRKETVGTTAVVLVFVIIIAIFLGAVDFVLSNLVRLIL